MTFEEFSMSVQYPNREEQFYKYYEHHVALFRLMCQYMNASSGFEISIQEKENGRISYFITCRGPAADFTMLAARINHNVVQYDRSGIRITNTNYPRTHLEGTG